jgi:gliding motility-associated-like protein
MIALNRLFRIIQLLALQWFIFCPVKSQTDFTANGDTVGCTDFHVTFTITTPSLSATDSIKWYFGFGDTVRSVGTSTMDVVYTQEGQYNVSLKIKNHPSAIKENYIKVHKAINALFRAENYAAGNSYRFIPYVQITDPVATYLYMWSYKDSIAGTTIPGPTKTVTISNPLNAIDSFTFNKGLYEIKLRLQDSYGCISAYQIPLSINDSVLLPNVFAPDGQQYYEIDPKDISIVLHIQVFNRYGMLIFEQEAPRILWDGLTFSGKEVNTGVYYYILKATQGDPSGKYDQKGFIHLFR